ncbi:penicillin-binding protein activator [Thalassospira marina]|uniref:Penicillin-binding protein activator n=1 Tax=Thalassospira marina TaxID=2048283 RepID=A0A2N3KVK7_9PROT|nr:penicillin-binding protein activator [Thalassospira marina]
MGFPKLHPSATRNGNSAWRRFACRTASVLVLSLGLGACSTDLTNTESDRELAPVVTNNGPDAATRAPNQGLIGEPSPFDGMPGDGQVLSGIYNDEAATTDKRVALLLPLSGPHGDLGRAMRHAAELALFDAAADDFVLMPIDTEASYEGGRLAAQKAINAGAKLILGPLFSDSVNGAGEVAKQAHVPVLSFSNNIRAAEPGVWVNGLSPEDQIKRAATYAVSQGKYSFAALLPQNEYGRQISSSLDRIVTEAGGRLGQVSFYQPGSDAMEQTVKDFAEYNQRHAALVARKAQLEADGSSASQRALQRLAGLDTLGDPDFNALILPTTGGDLRQVSALLAYFDVDPNNVQYIGTFGWNDSSLFAEPALNDGIFAAPEPGNWQAFSSRYKRTFGSEPPRIASLAYDSAALAAVLAGSDQGITMDGLTNVTGFSGIDGVFRLNADGRTQRGYAVMQISRSGAKMISPAPASFDAVF